MVTIRDVAREAGVSVATASRALNSHSNVTELTRKRITDAARSLNYVPHEGARSLTRRRANAIGVVLPDLFGEYFSELVRGIDRVAHAHGVQLLLSNMHGSTYETASAILAMRGRVDGLLVMTPNASDYHLHDLVGTGIPAVVLNSLEPGPGLPSVGIDNVGGARTMTAHLVERGYRRIAFVSGPRDNRDSAERQSGFLSAMAELTGERDPLIVPGDYSEGSGAAAARLLIAGRMPVDAIFCANDMMAIGVCTTLLEAGVAIGAEVGVAGFDDIPIAHYVSPSLTTMNACIAELGAAATERLMALMAGRDPGGSTVLMPQLIRRESTTRTPAARAATHDHNLLEGVLP